MNDESRTGLDRVTVAVAAKRLGITESAVRKRVERGHLAHDKDDRGRVWVYLRPSENQSATVSDMSRDEAMDILRDQVEYLRAQLEVWQEEARRKDHIIAALTERIPELEPAPNTPSNARESPVTASEEPSRGEAPEEPEKPKKRPWWRRLFE